MGNWGPALLATGVDLEYMDFLRAQAAEAVREAVATLGPANVEYTSFLLRDLPGGVMRYVGDNRDPQIVDDECRFMRFVEDGTDSTIATLINLGAHAEYTGDENQLISSDWPSYLRDVIEAGVVGPDGVAAEGLGGIAVFFNGAVGNQIGPNDVQVQTWSGDVLGEEESLLLAETVGTQLGYHALLALTGEAVVRDDTAAVGFRTHRFTLPVENVVFQMAFSMNVFPTRHPEGTGREMVITTQVSVIDIGRATILTVPGELDPALFVGGYDGSWTPEGVEIVDMAATNPPDLTAAPGPPYLKDLARADAEYVYLFGLTNDELGYFIPSFDYELADGLPYLEEAEGAHYEETNSLGPGAWPTVQARLEGLLAWTPE